VITLPLALAGAIPYWIWPGWAELPWILVLAATGSMAHYCFSRALAIADVSVVIPFDYLRLPFLAAIGFFAFGEVPEIWSWIGAGIIIASTLYIARREAVIARNARDN
jgi:drug/metabolite transporter (DMT)-like permease